MTTEQAHTAEWTAFEDRLGDYLGRMVDPGEADHLILELPEWPGLGTRPFAQFAGFGDGTALRAEVSGNRYLGSVFRLMAEERAVMTRDLGFRMDTDRDGRDLHWFCYEHVADAPVLARRVVRALRDVFKIRTPDALGYDAWGPAAADAATLGLRPSSDLPSLEPVPARREVAVVAQDEAHFGSLIEAAIAQHYDADPDPDQAGAYVLDDLDLRVLVEPGPRRDTVTFRVRVATGIKALRAAAVEAAVLNRDSTWSTWYLDDRELWARLVLPAEPLVPHHVFTAFSRFVDTVALARTDLLLRVDGEPG